MFDRIRDEQGCLDVLVANAWGGYMPYPEHSQWFSRPFWEQSMDRWDGMFTAGLRSHLATCLFGLPLLRETGYGLAVLTTFTRGRHYLGNVFYDVAKNAVCRLVTALAEETRENGPGRCGRVAGLDGRRADDRAVRPPAGQDGVGHLHRPRGTPRSPATRPYPGDPARHWPSATSPASTASPTSTAASRPPT